MASIPNPLLSWLVKDALPFDAATRQKYDLTDEYHADGQLKRFGRHEGWSLYLDHGKESGQARIDQGSGGTADSEIYSHGTFERFDAWSDNSKPQKMLFRDWVSKWIKQLGDSGRQRFEMLEEAEKNRAQVAAQGRRSVIKVVK